MAHKPILFNTKMVQAILEGRKTQTRRVITLPTGLSGKPVGESGDPRNPLGFMYAGGIKRPPCNKGDILWVRETWAPFCINKKTCRNALLGHFDFCYKASPNDCVDELGCKWHPSIHMPKEAARIFLRVKDVRLERLRDMNNFDLVNEGFDDWIRFLSLWNSTIKPADCDKYDWNANPWVWVIEFERCEKPEGWC